MDFKDGGVILPDVSFYQDDNNTSRGIDFEKMRAAGAAGVIIRAGQNTWVDEDFKRNWQAAKEAGLPRGTYWFYDSRVNPAIQAELWYSAVDGDLPELGAWIDLEEGYGGPYRGEDNWKKFMSVCDTLFSGVRIRGVYTANWWWSAQVVKDPALWGERPLWVAGYIPAKDVILPAPWRNSKAILWQYTNKGDGPKYGAESLNIDLNLFNGTPGEFRTYFGLSDDPTLPGGPMERYEAYSANNMSRRPAPHTNNERLGIINAGTRMYGEILIGQPGSGECWLKLTRFGNTTVTGDEYVAIEHAGVSYCTLLDRKPEQPPASDEYILYVKDGVTRKFVPER